MRRAIHPAELVAVGVALSLTVAAVNSAVDRAGLTGPRGDVVVAETEAPDVAPPQATPGVGDPSTRTAVLGERFTPMPPVETAGPSPNRVPTLDARNRLRSQDAASLPDDVVTSPAPASTGSVSRPAPGSPGTSPTVSRTSPEPAPSVAPTSAPTTTSSTPSPTTPATATDPSTAQPEPTPTIAVDVGTPSSTADADPVGDVPTSSPTGGAVAAHG